MPSTEQALLAGLLSQGLLVSCSLGMLASAFNSWSLSNRNSLEVARGTIIGGGREGCAHRDVVRWEKDWPSDVGLSIPSLLLADVPIRFFLRHTNN